MSKKSKLSSKSDLRDELHQIALLVRPASHETTKQAVSRCWSLANAQGSMLREVRRVLQAAEDEPLDSCAHRVMGLLRCYEEKAERDEKTMVALRAELRFIKDFTKFLIQS